MPDRPAAEHCGHIDAPCGCDNSPDPFQAFDAMRGQRDAYRDRLARAEQALAEIGVFCKNASACDPRGVQYVAVSDIRAALRATQGGQT